MPGLFVFGASGSGSTTIAAALGRRLGLPHFDTDDYYWFPTDPPFTDKRPVPERLALMRRDFATAGDFVQSGSMDGWGDPLLPFHAAAVFVTVPADERMRRLRQREAARYGADLAPGGRMHENSAAFMEWAAGYEAGDRPGRSLLRHEAWIGSLAFPVVRVANGGTLEASLDQVEEELAALGLFRPPRRSQR